MAQLHLTRVAREAPPTPGEQERARYVASLNESRQQLDFEIDGERLSERLQHFAVPQPQPYGFEGFDFVSVVDLVWPDATLSALRQLAGTSARSRDWPLDPGRLPLYVCPMCADLGCGAVTVEVLREPSVVTWCDFRLEDDVQRNDYVDLSGFPSITFGRDQYLAALLEPLPMLDALMADEAVAKAAWQRAQGPRS